MPLGFSYQPGAAQNIPMGNQQGAVPGVQPQGAAKILSLRIPHNVGPSAISPYSLLTSRGAQGAPDLNAMIAALLRTVQPPMNQQGGMMDRSEDQYPGRDINFSGSAISPLQDVGTSFPGQPQGQLPAPRIIPGDVNDNPWTYAPGDQSAPSDTPGREQGTGAGGMTFGGGQPQEYPWSMLGSRVTSGVASLF